MALLVPFDVFMWCSLLGLLLVAAVDDDDDDFL